MVDISIYLHDLWWVPAGEALYGGGSYQNGLVNYKGVPRLAAADCCFDG